MRSIMKTQWLNDCSRVSAEPRNQWIILKVWSERGSLPWETRGCTRRALFGWSCVLHGVRAKLSSLKSGQDRLALEASLSQYESVKHLVNRHTDVANWQPGRGDGTANKQKTSRSHDKAGGEETEDVLDGQVAKDDEDEDAYDDNPNYYITRLRPVGKHRAPVTNRSIVLCRPPSLMSHTSPALMRSSVRASNSDHR